MKNIFRILITFGLFNLLKLKARISGIFKLPVFYFKVILWHLGGWKKTFHSPYRYAEFGVGEGHSLRSFLTALNYAPLSKIEKSKVEIYLFDTFEGLPEPKSNKDIHPEWWPGRFEASVERIANLVKQFDFPIENVHFAKGLFSDTLSQHKGSEEFDLVNIDVDFYSSASEVLHFLETRLKPGAIVYFDDLWSFNGDPNFGVPQALTESALAKDLLPFSLCGSLGGRVRIHAKKFKD